jgi:putative addiction module component (TIGR02574 family)
VSPSTKKLLDEALHLSETERASLAGALIESLHAPAPEGVEAAWEEVIERRVREFEAGTAKTLPWSEVRAQLFSGYE